MLPPDQRAVQADLADGPFLIGVAKEQWGLADVPGFPAGIAWPHVMLWVAAAPRPNAPDRFHVRLDCQGYPTVPPTGMVWDLAENQQLPPLKRPKGVGQVAMMFRTDWENGRAFYHPYDRVAAQRHADWPAKYPHLVWNPATHTLVDLLSELHALLHCPDYHGV